MDKREYKTLAKKHYSEVIGLECSDIQLVAGGTLIIYFGSPDPVSELPPWRLHIEPAWRLEENATAILGSLDTLDVDETRKSSIEEYLTPLKKLVGHPLMEFLILSPIVDLSLTFEGNLRLKTFSHSLEGEGWELRGGAGVRIGMATVTEVRVWSADPDSKLRRIK